MQVVQRSPVGADLAWNQDSERKGGTYFLPFTEQLRGFCGGCHP